MFGLFSYTVDEPEKLIEEDIGGCERRRTRDIVSARFRP
jgi:hypothetical protein